MLYVFSLPEKRYKFKKNCVNPKRYLFDQNLKKQL